MTPLWMAALRGDEGVVERLLKARADGNKARTDDGGTPLYAAANTARRHEGVVDQLLKAGADANKASTNYGETPLYLAAEQGHASVVEKLLKQTTEIE